LDLQDKHSRAYQALTGDVGERMARILKLDAKRRIAEVPGVSRRFMRLQRSRAADLKYPRRELRKLPRSGLGLLGPHTTRDWQHENRWLGRLTPERNSSHRKCLECHLGSEKNS